MSCMLVCAKLCGGMCCGACVSSMCCGNRGCGELLVVRWGVNCVLEKGERRRCAG